MDTSPGRGSTFTVSLPMVDPASACGLEESPGESAADLCGKETVMVVEDEELVRAILCETLAERGYRVLEGRNPEHALELVRACRQPIQLLLTDIVMPRMNGRDLAEKVSLQQILATWGRASTHRSGLHRLRFQAWWSGRADRQGGQSGPVRSWELNAPPSGRWQAKKAYPSVRDKQLALVG